jgi:hypothetical protein
MKKQYTFKLSSTLTTDIYFLKISPSGQIELRSAQNKKMPLDWLSGKNTAEFDLLVAAALADSDTPDAEIERRLLKVIETYYPTIWKATVFSTKEILA